MLVGCRVEGVDMSPSSDQTPGQEPGGEVNEPKAASFQKRRALRVFSSGFPAIFIIVIP